MTWWKHYMLFPHTHALYFLHTTCLLPIQNGMCFSHACLLCYGCWWWSSIPFLRQQHSSRRRSIQAAAEVNCLHHPALIPFSKAIESYDSLCLLNLVGYHVLVSLIQSSLPYCSKLCLILYAATHSFLKAKSAIIPRCLAFLLASSLCHHMVAWKTGLT